MSAVKELKATLRPKAGKGAARTERRNGRTPAVIYGASEPPLAISLDHVEIRTRIYHGRFLTTLYDIDIDGKKHRVIPRDYQLDPVKDFLVHVDFLRVSASSKITVEVPVHFLNQDVCPGLKRGGVLNVVRHEVELEVSVTDIPEYIEVDLKNANIGDSIHISAVNLPAGAVPTINRDFTIATIAGSAASQSESGAA
jgi:large subunit ribosomal protein L25